MQYMEAGGVSETVARRWTDRRQLENLMGRRFSLVMLTRRREEWQTLWCREAAAPELGTWQGTYVGYEAIEAYFTALEAQYVSRLKAAQAKYPELAERDGKTLTGAGSLNLDTLTTPVIEVSDDGQTAQGLWYIVGLATENGVTGAEGAWKRGPLWASFVKENGQWRIWRLYDRPELFCRAGENFAVNALSPADFAPCGAALPQPTLPPTQTPEMPAAGEPLQFDEQRGEKQERAFRVNAVMEIKNLLARRCYYEATGNAAAEFDTLWTAHGQAEYTQNDLTLSGIVNIRRAFENRAARLLAGERQQHTLTTPLIEVARDGKTAQGFWYSLGSLRTKDGPGFWVNGRVCADFVYEDGTWRLWRLFRGTDLTLEAGHDRAGETSATCNDVFCELSAADVEGIAHRCGMFYDTRFNWNVYPALPVPYAQWGDGVSNLPREEVEQ